MEVAEDISRDASSSTDQAPARRKLQLAIVAPSLRYVGGQSVQADLLLRHWQSDPDVRVSFIAVDPPFPAGLRWASHVPLLRTIVRTPFYLTALWRDLRECDVVHIFSASYCSFLIAPLPAWLVATSRGKKTLINYHSGEARDHLNGSSIARAVLKRTNRVVSPSGYLVEVFRDFGIEAESVSNIIDCSQFTYRERSPLRPHLVCTRGFHPYYEIDVVVKTYAEIKKEYPGAQLDLIGGGSLEGEIRRLVSELKLTGVNFCGIASRDEIGRYYDRADIFINGSRLDNMPVSILEAFASGTPVITTEPEGMRYLVDDGRTGLLSKVGDSGALAANVLRVLRDPDLAQRLSANAFAQIPLYSWEQVREQWLNIYRELVPQPAARG